MIVVFLLWAYTAVFVHGYYSVRKLLMGLARAARND